MYSTRCFIINILCCGLLSFITLITSSKTRALFTHSCMFLYQSNVNNFKQYCAFCDSTVRYARSQKRHFADLHWVWQVKACSFFHVKTLTWGWSVGLGGFLFCRWQECRSVRGLSEEACRASGRETHQIHQTALQLVQY